jgi:hypothetical protein
MTAGTASSDDYAPAVVDEYERLFAFRLERFKGLGFNEYQAFTLAEAHVDWHDAERLRRGKCPTDVAVDILI